jgi:hypothetical protein
MLILIKSLKLKEKRLNQKKTKNNLVGVKLKTLELTNNTVELNLNNGTYIVKSGNQTSKIKI